MTRFTTKKLKMLIREEKMSAKMYRKAGYPVIARQESAHARKLNKELMKRLKK